MDYLSPHFNIAFKVFDNGMCARARNPVLNDITGITVLRGVT